MYAIIQSGSQQFKVQKGTILRLTSVAKLDEKQKTLDFPVLALQEGKNLVFNTKAQVSALVLRSGLTKKEIVFKKKRRKGYRRTKGHRQNFVEIKVSEIKVASKQTGKSV